MLALTMYPLPYLLKPVLPHHSCVGELVIRRRSREEFRLAMSGRRRHRRRDDNEHYERLGGDNITKNQFASKVFSFDNGAEIWVAAEKDFEPKFLRSFHPTGQVFTCKDRRQGFVDDACADAGWPAPIVFNVGYQKHRVRDFTKFFLSIKDLVEKGSPVILHCRSGVHRAALSCCLVLMYGLAIPFDSAVKILRERRFILIEEILEPTDGRERHADYVYKWERHALAQQEHYKFQICSPMPRIKLVANTPMGTPSTPQRASVVIVSSFT